MGQTRNRLMLFVAVSALLHAWVLAYQGSDPAGYRGPQQPLAVALNPPPPAAPASAPPASAGQRSAQRPRSAKPAPAPATMPAARQASGPQPPERASAPDAHAAPAQSGRRAQRRHSTPPSTASARAPASTADSDRQLRDYLSDMVAIVYPPLAQRRGWEGKVVLELRIGTNGHIDAVELAQSSGYRVLDASALAALRIVTRIPDRRYWPQRTPRAIRIPVVYRLQAG